MSLQTAMLATLIVIAGAAQYTLCYQALRDLRRRPRVRGDNKALWGLGILCVPIAGALIYNWMGPTSFLRRPVATTTRAAAIDEPGFHALQPLGDNVTPITAARSIRRRRVTATTPAQRGRTARRTPTPISRIDRTGS